MSILAAHLLRDGHEHTHQHYHNRGTSARHHGQRPQLPECYLCKQRFGHASIEIHQAQCYAVCLLRWERSDPDSRQTKPLSPEQHEHLFGAPEWRSLKKNSCSNERAERQREEPNPCDPTVVSCPTCARHFHVNNLKRHLALCRPRSSSSRGRAEARRRSPQHHDLQQQQQPQMAISARSCGNHVVARVETSYNSPGPGERIFQRALLLNNRGALDDRLQQITSQHGAIGLRPSSSSPTSRNHNNNNNHMSASRTERARMIRDQLEEDELEREAEQDDDRRVGHHNNAARLPSHQHADYLNDDYDNDADEETARRHRLSGRAPEPFPLARTQKPDSVLEAEKLFPVPVARSGTESPEAQRPPPQQQPPSHLHHEQQQHQQQQSGSYEVRSNLPRNLTKLQEELTHGKLTLQQRLELTFERCRHCSKTFAPDRISVHENVCIERFGKPQRGPINGGDASPRQQQRRPQSAGASSVVSSPSPRTKRCAMLMSTVKKPAILSQGTVMHSSPHVVRASDADVRAAASTRARILRCNSCGVQLVGAARFCSSCGERQEGVGRD